MNLINDVCKWRSADVIACKELRCDCLRGFPVLLGGNAGNLFSPSGYITMDNDKVITAASLQLILNTLSEKRVAIMNVLTGAKALEVTAAEELSAKKNQLDEATRELLAYGKEHYPSIYRV